MLLHPSVKPLVLMLNQLVQKGINYLKSYTGQYAENECLNLSRLEKMIELSPQQYKTFLHHMLARYDFIYENIDCMYQCDGVLV